MNRFYTLFAVVSLLTTTGFAQKARNLTQAIHYIKLASTLRDVDKSDASVDLLQRALPAVRSKDLYWEAVTNELLGLAYNDMEQRTNALRHLGRARTQYARLRYVASAWAVNEVIRDISGKNLYAGIQIGPSDVKVAIFKTKYESEFYEKDIRTTFTIPNNLMMADASASIRGGRDVLAACLDSIRRYDIPNERVFIVFSDDIKDLTARTPGTRKNLYSQLSGALPDATLRIDTTFTDAREAELFTIGSIPRKVWPSTSALSIGSNSTLGGYFEGDRKALPGQMNKTFHPVDVPVGINTLVNQIESKRSLNMEAYKREAQRVIKAIADSALAARLSGDKAGLAQRQTVGVGGDIALAVVACLHPDKADVTAIPILMADIERFRQLALNDYRSLTRPDLSVLADPVVRSKAEKDLLTVQNQLNEKQLIAGALWLESLMKAYSASGTPKRFVFVRNADIGWVTGKFLETINFEYESTIAKGALYTR